MTKPAKPYAALALDGLRRQLTRLDRRPWSPTYGCFDREYWSYRTLVDFPRLVFQTSALSLALFYLHPFEGNELGGSPEALAWAEAALAFWCRARNSDGSVDEWFRNERSFCATAFTTLAMAETALLLREKLSPATREAADEALATSARWLARHTNREIGNQLAASLLALHAVDRLVPTEGLGPAIAARKAELLALQHEEGWFPEYGGADLGYGWLTLELLARFADDAGDEPVAAATTRLLEFQACFLQPDGSTGADCGTRSTAHVFPHGLALCAARGHETARWALERLRQGVEARRVPTPLTTDDTYSAYFYIASFTRAALAGAPSSATAERALFGRRYFPGAGLLALDEPGYHAVVALHKGGAWSLVSREGQRFGDAGYFVVSESGRVYSSQRAAAGPALPADPAKVQATAELFEVDLSLPLERHAVAFQLLTRSALRVPGAAERFTRLVKNRFVRESRLAPLELKRELRFDAGGCEVTDTLTRKAGFETARVYRSTGPGRHSPSSQLYSAGDARLEPVFSESFGRAAAEALNREGRYQTRFRVSL